MLSLSLFNRNVVFNTYFHRNCFYNHWFVTVIRPQRYLYVSHWRTMCMLKFLLNLSLTLSGYNDLTSSFMVFYGIFHKPSGQEFRSNVCIMGKKIHIFFTLCQMMSHRSEFSCLVTVHSVCSCGSGQLSYIHTHKYTYTHTGDQRFEVWNCLPQMMDWVTICLRGQEECQEC